jgi:hypothetical protein
MASDDRGDYGVSSSIRVDQLAWKYPHACFYTLDSKRWFGVAGRPPKVVVSLADYKRKGFKSDDGNFTLINGFNFALHYAQVCDLHP